MLVRRLKHGLERYFTRCFLSHQNRLITTVVRGSPFRRKLDGHFLLTGTGECEGKWKIVAATILLLELPIVDAYLRQVGIGGFSLRCRLAGLLLPVGRVRGGRDIVSIVIQNGSFSPRVGDHRPLRAGEIHVERFIGFVALIPPYVDHDHLFGDPRRKGNRALLGPIIDGFKLVNVAAVKESTDRVVVFLLVVLNQRVIVTLGALQVHAEQQPPRRPE